MKRAIAIIAFSLCAVSVIAQNTWQPTFRKANNIRAIASGTAVNLYHFPIVGAVDVWRFDMLSGNLVSTIKAQTYTVDDPAPSLTYSTAGPNGLVGVTHITSNNSGGFKLASQADTDFDVGAGESFTILIQFKSTNNGDTRWLFDFGTDGANTTGFTLLLGDTRLTMYTIGASGSHFARTDADTIANNGTFYTARIVYNRADAAPHIYLKAEGGAEVDMNVSKGGTDFSAMGAVTITTDPMSFFGPTDQNTSMWFGDIYQVAFAKGTTYDVGVKP